MNTRFASLFIVSASGLFLLGTLLIAAAQETCEATMEALFTRASEVCLGKADDLLCNGGLPPQAEPQGPVSNSLSAVGALVSVNDVNAIKTYPFGEDGNGGVLWMRVADNAMSAMLLGDVAVWDITPQGFPKWKSMVVQTSENAPGCGAAPANAFVIQSSFSFDEVAATRVVINGTSVDMRGTLVIQNSGDDTIFMVIEGEARIIANGATQNMVAGQEVRVTHAPNNYTQVIGQPDVPFPFEAERLRNFPMALLDRPTIMPQPGFVSTDGPVNMRSAPFLEADLLYQIPAGQVMTILGRNPTNDWYHVRLATGETGWMFAELLRRNHGQIDVVYIDTPVPPQRFGNLGTTARVSSQFGVTLRTAPDANFQPVGELNPETNVELLARSPYSPWVKVNAEGTEGWVALISLDTRSIISSLPVDYDVPPPPVPPPPTRVPGSWGGAFPDPECFPNC